MPPFDFTPEEIALIVWLRQFKADGGKIFIGHLDNGNWGVREVGRRCALMDQPAILTVFPIGQQVVTTDGI